MPMTLAELDRILNVAYTGDNQESVFALLNSEPFLTRIHEEEAVVRELQYSRIAFQNLYSWVVTDMWTLAEGSEWKRAFLDKCFQDQKLWQYLPFDVIQRELLKLTPEAIERRVKQWSYHPYAMAQLFPSLPQAVQDNLIDNTNNGDSRALLFVASYYLYSGKHNELLALRSLPGAAEIAIVLLTEETVWTNHPDFENVPPLTVDLDFAAEMIQNRPQYAYLLVNHIEELIDKIEKRSEENVFIPPLDGNVEMDDAAMANLLRQDYTAQEFKGKSRAEQVLKLRAPLQKALNLCVIANKQNNLKATETLADFLMQHIIDETGQLRDFYFERGLVYEKALQLFREDKARLISIFARTLLKIFPETGETPEARAQSFAADLQRLAFGSPEVVIMSLLVNPDAEQYFDQLAMELSNTQSLTTSDLYHDQITALNLLSHVCVRLTALPKAELRNHFEEYITTVKLAKKCSKMEFDHPLVHAYAIYIFKSIVNLPDPLVNSENQSIIPADTPVKLLQAGEQLRGYKRSLTNSLAENPELQKETANGLLTVTDFEGIDLDIFEFILEDSITSIEKEEKSEKNLILISGLEEKLKEVRKLIAERKPFDNKARAAVADFYEDTYLSQGLALNELNYDFAHFPREDFVHEYHDALTNLILILNSIGGETSAMRMQMLLNGESLPTATDQEYPLLTHADYLRLQMSFLEELAWEKNPILFQFHNWLEKTMRNLKVERHDLNKAEEASGSDKINDTSKKASSAHLLLSSSRDQRNSIFQQIESANKESLRKTAKTVRLTELSDDESAAPVPKGKGIE